MKKVFALLLAAVMMLSLFAGCNSGDSDKSENSKETSTKTEKKSDSSDSKSSGSEEEEPYTMTLLTDFPAEKNSKIFMETIARVEEICNVKIIIENAPSANYGERIQLTIASGEMPDAIIFNSTEDPMIKSSVQSGAFIALNEYLEDAPNLKEYISPIGFDALKYMGDDQIYGIPRHTFVRADGFAIRTDWLDKIGMSVESGKPITLDQFTEITEKFTTMDPDGNGQDDTYGITVHADANGDMFDIYAKDTFSAIMQGAFGNVGWQAYEDEDYDYMNLVFSQKADNFKNMLAYLQELYVNGNVDSDWPVLKKKQAEENFDQGRYGMSVKFPLHVPNIVVPNLQKVNPDSDATWISGIINPVDGKVTGTSFSNTCWGAWQVTSACERPDKVVQVFDTLLSEGFYNEQLIYGGEGVGYDVVDGKKVPTELYSNPDEGMGNSGRIVRRFGDPAVYLNLGYTEEEKTTYEAWLAEAVDNATLSMSLGFIPPVATSPQYLDYHKEMNETISKIIIGELPVEAYDETLAGWYENGGTEYVEQVNAYIKSLQ